MNTKYVSCFKNKIFVVRAGSKGGGNIPHFVDQGNF